MKIRRERQARASNNHKMKMKRNPESLQPLLHFQILLILPASASSIIHYARWLTRNLEDQPQLQGTLAGALCLREPLSAIPILYSSFLFLFSRDFLLLILLGSLTGASGCSYSSNLLWWGCWEVLSLLWACGGVFYLLNIFLAFFCISFLCYFCFSFVCRLGLLGFIIYELWWT